jgi:hypothetical protein
MKCFVLLPTIIMFWPLLKVFQKGWRLLAVLFLMALTTGCASTSSKFDKSPCACEFKELNTGSHRSKVDA